MLRALPARITPAEQTHEVLSQTSPATAADSDRAGSLTARTTLPVSANAPCPPGPRNMTRRPCPSDSVTPDETETEPVGIINTRWQPSTRWTARPSSTPPSIIARAPLTTQSSSENATASARALATGPESAVWSRALQTTARAGRATGGGYPRSRRSGRQPGRQVLPAPPSTIPAPGSGFPLTRTGVERTLGSKRIVAFDHMGTSFTLRAGCVERERPRRGEADRAACRWRTGARPGFRGRGG
jgi:hypothetical protein